MNHPTTNTPSLLVAGLELDEAARNIEAAAARHQAEIAALSRPDGQPLYGPTEDAERRAAIDAALAAVIDASHAGADAARQALATAQAAGAGDPIWLFGPAELQRLDTLSARAQADARRLPIQRLIERMRAAGATGDPITITAWGDAIEQIEARLKTTDIQHQQQLTTAMLDLADAANALLPKPDPRAGQVEQKIAGLVTRTAQIERAATAAAPKLVTPF